MLRVHGLSEHRPNGMDPIPARYSIQLSAEDEAPDAGNDLWRMPVEPDFAGAFLRSAEAYVRTAGSSVTQIQLHNLGTGDDLLTSRIEIDLGQKFSWASIPRSEPDPDMPRLELGDEIRVDMDAVGTGIEGLKLFLAFGPKIVRLS